ncbi:hypothetical protein HK097_006133, partial [Rhizophlyctis rosea]
MAEKTGKGKRSLAQMQEEDHNDPLGDMPDPLTDYKGWLAYEKKKWKRRRAERLTMRKAGIVPRAMTGGGGVQDYLQAQMRSMAKLPWHILQVAETDIPGDFTVWALVGDSLHSVKMSVLRTLYVNSKVPDDTGLNIAGLSMRRVNKILPRSHASLHLYELVMTEGFYRQNAGLFAQIGNEVEGVYESQIPLLFRALMHLGNTTKIEGQRGNRGSLDDRFQLEEFEAMQPDKRNSYMKDPRKIQWLYLYHAYAGSRHFMILISVGMQKAWVFVVDQAGNREGLPNVKQMYDEEIDKVRRGVSQPGLDSPLAMATAGDPDAFVYPDDMEFVSNVYRTEHEAMQALNRTLRDYKDQRRGATVLAVQSPRKTRRLMMDGISLIHDFPCIGIPTHKRDGLFPALGWQKYAARRMVSHFLNLDSYLKQRFALARMGNVPFCNLENDYTTFVADLALARQLKHADMVLWYSPSDKPDLGGREKDDNQCDLDELLIPEINQP